MKLEEIERIEELKRRIALEQNGLCAHCGKELVYPYDLAHIIPKGKVNMKVYGAEIIHNRLNMACTCRSADCNDSMMINPATQPLKAEEHVRKIEQAIKEDDPFYNVYMEGGE